MKNILIKQCNPKTCGEGYKEMWIDGELIFDGDSYHNNISNKIQGFILCLEFLKIEHIINYENIECTFYCN